MPFDGSNLFDRATAAAKRALGIEDEDTATLDAQREAEMRAASMQPPSPDQIARQQLDSALAQGIATLQTPELSPAVRNPEEAVATRAPGPTMRVAPGLFERIGAVVADPVGQLPDRIRTALTEAGIRPSPSINPRTPEPTADERLRAQLAQGADPATAVGEAQRRGAFEVGAELLGGLFRGLAQPVDPETGMPNMDVAAGPIAGLRGALGGADDAGKAARTLAKASAQSRKTRGIENAIERAPLDDAVKGEVRKNLDAARDIVPQKVVPQAEEVFASTEIPLERLNRIKPGDKLDNPTLYRASGRVADLATEVGRLELQIADLTDEAAAPLRSQVDAMRDEATRLLGAIDPTVSQNGRNLAFTKRLLKDFNPDELTTQALKIARSRRPGRLGGADEFEIRQAAARVGGAKGAGEREEALIDLSKALNTQRLGPLESVAAVRKAGLLTGFTTHVRNVGGNLGFQGAEMLSQNASALIESGLSVLGKDKTRLGSFTTSTVIKETLEGAGAGLREAGDILLRGASAEDLARYDFATEVRTTLGPASPVADKFINLSFRALSAGDRPFRVAALKRSIATQAEAAAKNANLTGGARRKFVEDFIATPPDEAGMQAIADSEFAVFANRNEASALFQKFRASKGDLGRAVIDQFVPFSKTPTNVLGRVLDYSGVDALSKAATLGSVRNLDPAKRKAFADAVGRGAVGWGMMSLGYWLAEDGMMTGPRARGDAGERQVEEAADMPGGSVRLGNAWLDTSTMAPTGTLLALGAAMYEADARQTSRAEAGQGAPVPKSPLALGAGGVGVFDATLQQPMVQGVENILRLGQQAAGAVRADDPAERAEQAIGDFAGRQAASFIPSIVAAAARASDAQRRDTFLPEEFRTDVVGIPVNTAPIRERIPAIPGLTDGREALPAQVDAQGNPVQANPIEAFLPVRQSNADGFAEAAALSQIGFGPPGRREEESDADYAKRVADTNRHVFQRAVAPLLVDGGSTTIGSRTFLVQATDSAQQRRQIIEKAIEAARTEIRGRTLNPETGVWER